ncbi:hypothetical protein [Streptomyces turgidiscabies]|uniref:hypothetical protein n=1 Tax=Streptomyces turgidiscabies TaxID=85558 RepID=UPI0027D7A6A8|nr:hypothetical protein [Streptomyces turgidiscabies]
MPSRRSCATGCYTTRPAYRTAGRTRLRIAEGRPWAGDLVNAFTRLTELPRPIT